MAAVKLGIRRKIALVLGLFLLAFFLVIVKLGVVQLIQAEDLQARADDLRTRDMTVDAARGTIFDRNGSKLAISITADSIAVRPSEINSLPDDEREREADKTARTLANILDLDYQEVYDKVTSDQSYVYIERKVDFEQAEQIREADLTGVEIEEETQRYYPKGTLAAHVLGFAGIDNNGLEGIELALEDVLAGQDGRIVGEYDANDNPIPQAEYEYIAPQDGYDVYLTIDENIQYFCERELTNLMNSEFPPKNAGVIVMDPKSGEILAMAVANTYDPNNFAEYDESVRRNFLVNDSYEPGSTFKIITTATALEEGTATTSSTYYCPGYIMVAGSRIGCWASVPHENQTLAEAVQNSCNPAFVTIGQSIEAKEDGLFYKYIEAFGFGQTTGIELSGEASGILQAEENVNQVEIATIAMGQGISVTPMQMITAVSAVANDGVLLRPTLVSKVMDGDETVYEHQAEEVRRVVSAETAQLVRELIVNVVTDGSGTQAAIEGYTIGGKTGTAQKPGEGGYAAGKYVASFIGMVPADDPELVCLVVVDEPSGVYYGSQVAAPVFHNVMSDTLRYLGIDPEVDANDGIEDGEDNLSATVPGVVNYSVADAITTLQQAGFNVKLSGSGNTVTSQQPAGETVAKSGSTVLLTAGNGSDSGGMVTVPDLRGKRYAEVANILSVLGLSLAAEGTGEAYSQTPDYGAVVPSGSAISVKFDDTDDGITVIAP